jgi:hypothetical protein
MNFSDRAGSQGISIAGRGPLAVNAIALLSQDHRQIEKRFEEFQATNSPWREEEIAFDLCAAIRVHTEIDAKIFYPAFLGATGDRCKSERALQQHRDINTLIDEIERAGPTEDTFFAKIYVLCDLFRRHVQDEEKPHSGIFTAAEESDLDLEALGADLEQHREQLLHDFGTLEDTAPS